VGAASVLGPITYNAIDGTRGIAALCVGFVQVGAHIATVISFEEDRAGAGTGTASTKGYLRRRPDEVFVPPVIAASPLGTVSGDFLHGTETGTKVQADHHCFMVGRAFVIAFGVAATVGLLGVTDDPRFAPNIAMASVSETAREPLDLGVRAATNFVLFSRLGHLSLRTAINAVGGTMTLSFSSVRWCAGDAAQGGAIGELVVATADGVELLVAGAPVFPLLVAEVVAHGNAGFVMTVIVDDTLAVLVVIVALAAITTLRGIMPSSTGGSLGRHVIPSGAIRP
jgi:hypothetical protein